MSAYSNFPPSLCCNPWFFSGMTFFGQTLELQISLICSTYVYLSNLYFHTMRSMTVFESSKQGKFQSAYTNLSYFLLLTYSHSQNSKVKVLEKYCIGQFVICLKCEIRFIQTILSFVLSRKISQIIFKDTTAHLASNFYKRYWSL